MKTIIKIFICLSLIYTPMFANAAVGGWDLKNPVAQGASTVYDATKNVVINGKNYIKDSWVKITPNASQVAKVLARGGAGYALSVAVEQLIGAVDWVLDPANNRIIYYPPDSGYIYHNNVNLESSNVSAYGHVQGCKAILAYLSKALDREMVYSKSTGGLSPRCYYGAANYEAAIYATAVDKEEKYLPLPVVAQKVISNAAAGDASAQQATTAAAADIVAEAEKDDAKARPIASQAEANAETKPADAAEAEKANEAHGQTKPNEANPEATDISLEFPVFCNWAPTICEAAQVVISFPNTLTGWYTDTKSKVEEWATAITDAYHDFLKDDELPNDDTKVDITELPVPELKEDAISWGASCPADVSIPISMQGVSSTLVFSWSPWCQLLSIIKPAIIASAYIGAAFIVLGLRT